MLIRLALFLLLMPLASAAAAPTCSAGPPAAQAAAAANTATIETLQWAPFRRDELGWATYAPQIATEIASGCPFGSPGFALALARWQRAHGLPANGLVDADSFAAMNAGWHRARRLPPPPPPGECPGAHPAGLATASPRESYGGKTIQLHPDTLAAYRRLVAAARRAVPDLRRDGRWLTIFSAFRAPDADGARCETEGNCDGIVRAACSYHRTGRALDLYVGQAPGLGPDSTDDTNRRAMSRTATYRWLVVNARRFGFANYVFEPWHWEYAGPSVSRTPVSTGPVSTGPVSTAPRPSRKTPA